MEPYYAIVIKAFLVRPTLINSSLWSETYRYLTFLRAMDPTLWKLENGYWN